MRWAIAAAAMLIAPVLSGCIGIGGGDEDVASLATRELTEPTVYEHVGDGIVRIHRDAFGVPHIYADDEESLLWGMGYAQAEDRLFQMDLFRRAGKGRLAEVLGEDFLVMDQQTRRVGLTEEERWQLYDTFDSADRAAMDAYVSGINAAIADAAQDPTGLPVELVALTDVIEPWTPTDSIAFIEVVLAGYGSFGGNELDNARLLADLQARYGDEQGWALFNDIVPRTPIDPPTSIARAELSYEGAAPPERPPASQLALLEPAVLEAGAQASHRLQRAAEAKRSIGFPTSLGSNAVLIAPELSASGDALLLGGPQTGLSVPSFFWEASLHGAGFDAHGITVPGIPGIVIGRTAHVAWTITSGYSDTVDLFVEEVVDGRVQQQDGSSPLDVRVETFLVRPPLTDPGEPRIVVEEMARGPHGPIVATSDDGRWAIARQAVPTTELIADVMCLFRVGQTTSHDEFAACMDEMAPNFNFFYADDTGTIAYHHNGRFPDREPGFDARLPLPGHGSADWRGWLDANARPQVVGPERGWLVNWNNAPAAGWPEGDQRNWGVAHRAAGLERIVREALDEHGRLTLDDLEAINERAATSDVHAFRMRGAIEGAPDGPVRDALISWIDDGAPIRDDDGDGRVDADAVAAYEVFITRLMDDVLGDVLGQAYQSPNFPREPFSGNADDHGSFNEELSLLVRILGSTTREAWVDDADASIAEALAAAEPALREGRPMAQQVFAPMGGLALEPIDRMDRGSYNQLVELTTPPTMRNVLPPGNRGLVPVGSVLGAGSSQHTDDQLGDYAGFTYKVEPFTVPDVEAAASGTLELQVRDVPSVAVRIPSALREALDAAGVPPISVLGELTV